MAVPDSIRSKYSPLKDKNLTNALAHHIGREFPRIGGPRIRELCASMILEVLDEHRRPREDLTHGQVLWMAVNRDEPPRRHQRLADTTLIPVVLDLSLPDDIDRRIARVSAGKRLQFKARRLCHQAFEQGGLLSNCDVAELLGCTDVRISQVLREFEDAEQTIVPRRANIHDVGSGLTHKRIICWKRYAEGKSPDQVARETYHSLEGVDRYLGQYDRVRHCRLEGLTPQRTADVLDCTVRLVEEYLAIDRLLEDQPSGSGRGPTETQQAAPAEAECGEDTTKDSTDNTATKCIANEHGQIKNDVNDSSRKGTTCDAAIEAEICVDNTADPAVRSTKESSTAENSARATTAGESPIPWVNFVWIRSQVTLQQLLEHSGHWRGFRASGKSPDQYRGRCPFHTPAAGHERRLPFSLNTSKDVFQCFESSCGVKGNALDYWRLYRGVPYRKAAWDLARTFGLTAEPPKRTPEAHA